MSDTALPIRSSLGRAFSALGYIGFAVCGLALVLIDQFPAFYSAMGWFCLLGGTMSAAGTATGRWSGEFMGLPLLVSAMGTFIGLTIRDQWQSAEWMIVPTVGLLVGIIGMLVSRWDDVRAVAKAARSQAEAVRDGEVEDPDGL